MAVRCCLINRLPPPATISSNQNLPSSTASPMIPWKLNRQLIAAAACLVIGLEPDWPAMAVDGSYRVAGDVSEKVVAAPKWSDKRMCPAWQLNSLETIVPENLPRPSARRRWESVEFSGGRDDRSTAARGREGFTSNRNNSNKYLRGPRGALTAMEKISAASAMEWSIELDKGLRSKKPGQAVKAIQLTGQRLQQWDQEPESTTAAYKILGLVPGEERLFLNSILLKLADAFRSGEKDVKVSIVRVFLSLFKKRRKSQRYRGILLKAKICNSLELLKRVKAVFDAGDLELRVLALVLFGCWADFAKDDAHIRYVILSSCVSSDILEVKASLFAAGCFCEFADDFAHVVLEMLPHILTSSELSPSLRVAGARMFAKLGYFSPIANNAYKMGLKLLLNSSDEDLSVSFLLSLSKLAYKSSTILTDQVEVLLSFLSQEKSFRLQSTALRCLQVLLSQVCPLSVVLQTIRPLLRIVHGTEFPISMQCKALEILHKMLMYQEIQLPPGDVMLDFSKICMILENSTQSHLMPKRVLAIHVLADVFINLSGQTDMEVDGGSSFPSPTWIISTIFDQIILLVKQVLVSNNQTQSGALQEVRKLLNLVLFAAGESLDLVVIALDKIRLIMEHLVNHLHEKATDSTLTAPLVQEIDDHGVKSFNTMLNFALIVHNFSVTCVQNLIGLGANTAEVLTKIKLLVDCVHRFSLFDFYVHALYSALVHSEVFWNYVLNKTGGSPERQLENSTCDLLIKHEIFTLECAMKMMNEGTFWKLYRTGIFAVGQGSWVTAAFVFELITCKVQSESSSRWLKSLAQYAQCEMKIRLFLLPKLRSSLAEWSQTNAISVPVFRNIFCGNDQGVSAQICEASYSEVLFGAHNSVRSFGETLDCIVGYGNSFCFQRWLCALRAKVLETVNDILKVLGSVTVTPGTGNRGHAEGSLAADVLSSSQQIAECSLRLTRLAKELDLVCISFVDIDIKSSKIISAFALSCSLLAFTTGISVSTANGSSHLSANRALIEDLATRLWLIDPESCSDLFQLLVVNCSIYSAHMQQPRNQKLKSGDVRDLLGICDYVVSSIIGLQTKLKRVDNLEVMQKVTGECFQLLSDSIDKWVNTAFQLPKYFFKTRPCLVSNLIVFSADAINEEESLVVEPGSHLSLNLCIQLKNVPDPLHITKLYCILYSSTCFTEESNPSSREQVQLDFRDWQIDDMVQANRKLYRYVKDRANNKTGQLQQPRDEEQEEGSFVDDGDGISAESIVEFEMNSKGQGFSSCLVDVSGFPEGCYRMKWHIGFVDSRQCYWSLLPQNSGSVFTVQKLLPPVGND
ncbi:Integrator complex subunit 7 homolog [Linum perenne]